MSVIYEIKSENTLERLEVIPTLTSFPQKGETDKTDVGIGILAVICDAPKRCFSFLGSTGSFVKSEEDWESSVVFSLDVCLYV